MTIIGIFLIALGALSLIFNGSSSGTDLEKELVSKFEELKKSSSVRLLVIDNTKVNIGLIILGLILLFL